MDQQAIEGMRKASELSQWFRSRPDQRWTTSQARLFQAVETVFAVGRDDLRAATRGRCRIAFARQTGMYLAHVTLGMTLLGAGHLFGRDRTTASHACRVVEDLRDDPGFDALLRAMEAFVVRPVPRNARAGQ
jgi:chromosomal replication initiation ATPase DnaA